MSAEADWVQAMLSIAKSEYSVQLQLTKTTLYEFDILSAIKRDEGVEYMIPIPKYLREIAKITDGRAETLTMDIRCPCGCGKFFVLENVPKKAAISKEDAQKIRLTKQWYKENVHSKLIYSYKSDGLQIAVQYAKIGDHGALVKDKGNVLVHRFKEGEIPLSEQAMDALQPLDYNFIIKAVCADCKNEYTLFDNRIHGNDAADFKPRQLEEYAFKQKKINGSLDTPAEIQITIKNFWDFDDIAGNGNEDLTADDYSEMFGNIKIKAVTAEGKKITLYAEDLG